MKKAKGIRKTLGLMFRTRKTEPLKFEFTCPVNLAIHSYFVFFSFMAYWYDEKGNLIQSKLINPFESNIKCKKKFTKLVEVPI